jgi:hypothetical protein
LGTVEEMTREEGPERTQRTVAELLAKYGAGSDESAPRRRRRRADDAEETAPQAIIDRVLSDSGSMPRIPADDPPPQPQPPPAPTSRHRPVPQPPQPPPPAPPAPPVTPPPSIAAQALQPTQRQMPPVAPPERQQRRMPPSPQSSQSLPRPKPQPSSQWPVPPAEPGGLAARLDGRQDSRSDMRVPVEPPPTPMPAEGVTEQMPRIPDELPAPGNRTGQHPAPHRVARSTRGPQPSMPLPQPAYPKDEPDNYPTEYHGFEPVGEATQYAEAPQFGEATQYAEAPQFGEATQYVEGIEQDEDYEDSRRSMRSIEDERPIGGDDFDEDEDDEKPGSPVKEWLSMAGQLAIGVIGGAALWLGFNWLWGQLPAAALVVALVVIVGLVWVVRKIRRADDLQTTILTVLVGLVVTVSPAAMLLLNR